MALRSTAGFVFILAELSGLKRAHINPIVNIHLQSKCPPQPQALLLPTLHLLLLYPCLVQHLLLQHRNLLDLPHQ